MSEIPYAIPIVLHEEKEQHESHYKKHYEIFVQKQNEALLDLKKYSEKWTLLLLKEIT